MKKKYPKNTITSHRNIEKTFKAKWSKFFDELPPATPEIDLVRGFKNREEQKMIEGIEVKYFWKAKTGRSYIEGFGQSLGLLLWGFDRVSLYHIFDYEFDETERKRFVRTSVELSNRLSSITYRAFLARRDEEIKLFQLDNSGSITEEGPSLHPGKFRNPFLKKIDNQIRRRKDFITTEILGFVP